MSEWYEKLKAAVTIIDKEGKIIEMNTTSCKVFEKYGGGQLIGQSVFECHSDSSRSEIEKLLANHKTNYYTIEKEGIKKLFYQTPWYQDGQFGGIVELSFEIPFEIPNFVKK